MTTPSAAALTEQIAGLLAEHKHNLGVCLCGYGENKTFGIDAVQHRAHLAQVLAARVADSRPVVW